VLACVVAEVGCHRSGTWSEPLDVIVGAATGTGDNGYLADDDAFDGGADDSRNSVAAHVFVHVPGLGPRFIGVY
jgi:hypothetical protein